MAVAETYGARQIHLPEGIPLTDEEVVRALTILSERKLGDPGFSVEVSLEPEYYTLKVPTTVKLSKDEIVVSLTRLNQAAEHGYAEVQFSFENGQMAKRGWVLLKNSSSANFRSIRVGGTPRPESF